MRAAALVLLFILLSGCASPGDPPTSAAVELVDIHGLALDPSDASRLFVATHRGLLLLANDRDWSYVGEARDDYMGFAAHPTDPRTFWASGHPRTGGNLGVVRTTDGGATWARVGAEGVDFHAMAVSPADPARLWGSWRGALQRSDDAGATWAAVGSLAAAALAGHPTDRDVVFAATGKGLQRSNDGGATWTLASSEPIIGVGVDPSTPATIYAGTRLGAVRSTDGGRLWQHTSLTSGAIGFFATHAETPGLVYAASYERGIFKSVDSGATWTTVRAPS